MKKILITAVGGDIGYGLIKAIKASDHDLHIVGCDIRNYNVSYDMVDEFYICPPYSDEEKWIDFILGLLKQGVDYFWPVTEPEIKIVMENKERFSDCKIVINEDFVLDIAMNKEKTASFLSDNGILTPQTWEKGDEIRHSFPLIVKERFGCGSHGVYVVNDENELNVSLEYMEDPIVQEYVGDIDEEYTLTVFSDGQVINYILFKRELGFGGMSRYVELVHDEKVETLAGRIAKIFNLKGSLNIQMRKKNSDYCVFEINPRISSTIGFRYRLGFNDASWWIDMIEGKSIPNFEQPKGRVYGVRSVEEKFFFE